MKGFRLRRRFTLGEIKAGLRPLMNDYGVGEAHLEGPGKLDDDSMRPEWVRLFYFPAPGVDDFDLDGFEDAVRKAFRGQVHSMLPSRSNSALERVRRENVTPFD